LWQAAVDFLGLGSAPAYNSILSSSM